MRSPVQSRVPLLDKNKAFGRLPLLGAFFFFTSGLRYGLRQRQIQCNMVQQILSLQRYYFTFKF